MSTEIIEGSKIIAEFDGWYQKERPAIGILSKENPYFRDNGKQAASVHGFKYHSSWDWLMPACKKWDRLFEVIKMTSKKYSVYEELSDKLDLSVTLYEIDEVFEQLVVNVKWLNSQKWYQNQILNNTINH